MLGVVEDGLMLVLIIVDEVLVVVCVSGIMVDVVKVNDNVWYVIVVYCGYKLLML